jgi:hypothetical protein
VTTSSLPQIYSTTLDSSSFANLQTIQIQALTTADISILTGSSGSYTYTVPPTSGSTVTVNTSGTSSTSFGTTSYIWKTPEEFEDSFPAWDRIQKMCKKYPGLEIALEKFKTTYYLVKDDYDNPKQK